MNISPREKLSSYLENEFLQRKENNPAYSLRAFARLLGVDHSTFAKFLKGERDLSWTTINKCFKRLSSPIETVEFFEKEKDKLITGCEKIEEALFNAMSDWKYWAVLEYLKIDPRASEETIAKRFHFELIEAEHIISTLVLLGFVKKDGRKYKLLKPNNSWIDNSKTSEARKELQRKLSKLSHSAIDSFSIDERYHGSLTIAIDKESLPLVKKKLNAFQAELGGYLQKKRKLNEVYQLTISLFPLTMQEPK